MQSTLHSVRGRWLIHVRSLFAAVCIIMLGLDLWFKLGDGQFVPFVGIVDPSGHARFTLHFLVDRESPRLLGEGHEAKQSMPPPMDASRVATVEVHSRVSVLPGLWAPTRWSRSVRLQVEMQDILAAIEHAELLDRLRAESLSYLRAAHAETANTFPDAIDRSPFLAGMSRTEAKATNRYWPGYVHNIISLGTLAALVWAIWPRRTGVAAAPTTRAPDDGPRPAG